MFTALLAPLINTSKAALCALFPQVDPAERPDTALRVRRPGYIGGSGAKQAGAVISGAAAVVLRQHPLGPTIRSSLDLNHDKIGSQTDPAQGKDTLTLSMKRGRLEA